MSRLRHAALTLALFATPASAAFGDGGNAPLRPGLDMGLLYRWAERYAFGFSLINWNGPSVPASNFLDRAPAEVRFGVSESARGFTMTLDAAKREPSGRHPPTGEFA